MANENGPTPRCPECNHKGGHSAACRAGIDDSKPMDVFSHVGANGEDRFRAETSAERYRRLELPGRADADIRPTGERYYPLGHPIPDGPLGGDPEILKAVALETSSPLEGYECDCGHGSQPGEQHLIGCPVEVAWATSFGRSPAMDDLPAVTAHNAEQRSELIAGVSGLDPVADARARAATVGLNPKDLVGAVKTPLGLLPWTALVQVAGVFAVGAEKYGAYNWRTQGQPVQHVTYVAAAFRHLAAYMDGQTLDPETGCNHLAHAACGLLILLDASAVGNAIDNRPTPGVAAEIMKLP